LIRNLHENKVFVFHVKMQAPFWKETIPHLPESKTFNA